VPCQDIDVDQLASTSTRPYDAQLTPWMLLLHSLQKLPHVLGRLALGEDRVVSRVNYEIAHGFVLPNERRA
jgi:hypothetical protein